MGLDVILWTVFQWFNFQGLYGVVWSAAPSGPHWHAKEEEEVPQAWLLGASSWWMVSPD